MNSDTDGRLDTKFVEGGECAKVVLGDIMQTVGEVKLGDMANYATVNIDGGGSFEVGNINFGSNNLNTNTFDSNENRKNKTNTKVKASVCNLEDF